VAVAIVWIDPARVAHNGALIASGQSMSSSLSRARWRPL
jgi:hypothetical protein